MDSNQQASRTRVLATKVLHHVLKVLAESDGFVTRADVVASLKSDLEYSEWELAETEKAGTPRWRNALWYTADAVKAGFMEKSRGKWRITQDGREALETQTPEQILATVSKAYQEWYESQQADEDDNGTSEQAPSVKGQILRHGMVVLAHAPDLTLAWEEVFKRAQRQIPEDILESLVAYDPDWPNHYGYRVFHNASRAGWVIRSAGTWTLTQAGVQALKEWPDPGELVKKAKQAASSNPEKEKLPYLGKVSDFSTIPPTLYQVHTASVGHLVSEINQGTLALPDIQRPFVWKNAKVRDLLDSMFRGFPFGFFLTWKSPESVASRTVGVNKSNSILPNALVIDGQQRLTSLFAVITGHPVIDSDFRERKIHIAFHPIRGIFDVTNPAIRKNPEWLPDVSLVFTEQMGALAVVRKYLERLESSREIDDDHRRVAEQNISRLVNLANVHVNVLQIGSSADEEQVAEIFVRINSKGQNLRQADFILTLLAVFWEQGREDLEDFARACRQPTADGRPSPFNHKLHPGPDDLVRVAVAVGHRRAKLSAAYQVLRGKDLKTGEITPQTRDDNITILEKAQTQVLSVANWQEYLKVLSGAGYRHKKLLQSEITALYAYSLFLIGRVEIGVPLPDLRRLIGRWFMMSTVTGRYVGGPSESMMEEDLARLRDVTNAEGYHQALEHAMATELTNDFWEVTLPSRLESSNTRTLASFFAAQSVLGAKALFSQLSVAELLDPSIQSTKEDLEYHHLFPKGWLRKNGVKSPKEYNQIANLGLLEWSANIEVSDEDPAKYAPRLEKRLNMEESEVQEMYRMHALPRGWWTLDYFEFLEKRRVAMAGLIRGAFEKIN